MHGTEGTADGPAGHVSVPIKLNRTDWGKLLSVIVGQGLVLAGILISMYVRLAVVENNVNFNAESRKREIENLAGDIGELKGDVKELRKEVRELDKKIP